MSALKNIPFSIVLILIPILVLTSASYGQDDGLYRIENSFVHFKSNAPLELIEASTRGMSGLIDPEDGSFALSIPINSFFGFNSPLQKEHFNANYMESHRYNTATFVGRIIEDLNFSIDGTNKVRAKGTLNIHNVDQERMIPCTMTIQGNTVILSAGFTVLLRDHNISIPKIVEQKIASEIKVEVDATFITEKAN